MTPAWCSKMTPLHFAAREGLKDAVAALIKARANVDAVDNVAQTPLHIAADHDFPQPRRVSAPVGFRQCQCFVQRLRPIAKADAVLAGLGRTGEAIAVLSGATTPELLNDLGAILLKDGRRSEAIAAFTRASRIEAASRAAILAGNWDWVIENADEPLSEASSVLRSAASPGAGFLIRPSNGPCPFGRPPHRHKRSWVEMRSMRDGSPSGSPHVQPVRP